MPVPALCTTCVSNVTVLVFGCLEFFFGLLLCILFLLVCCYVFFFFWYVVMYSFSSGMFFCAVLFCFTAIYFPMLSYVQDAVIPSMKNILNKLLIPLKQPSQVSHQNILDIMHTWWISYWWLSHYSNKYAKHYKLYWCQLYPGKYDVINETLKTFFLTKPTP